MSGILISLTGNQNNIYALFVNNFSSTIPSLTFLHKCDIYNLINVFFMCKRHLEHCNVKCVENDSRKKGNHKTHTKKAHTYFGSKSKISRFQTLFLQNPTIPNYIMSFSNRAQRFTGSNYLDVDSPFKLSNKK